MYPFACFLFGYYKELIYYCTIDIQSFVRQHDQLAEY